MKKKLAIIVLNLIIMMFILIAGCTHVEATSDTFTLNLEIINNKKEENIDVCILLSKEYIIHAINQDQLKLDYEGAKTLKENEIPSIKVNPLNVKDNLYVENGVEYVQILLEKTEKGTYEFDILSSYEKMDMKYRIKNLNKDYIMHIDNFKAESGICEIKYDYEKDTIKQPDQKIIPFATKALLLVLIVVVIIGIIAYKK